MLHYKCFGCRSNCELIRRSDEEIVLRCNTCNKTRYGCCCCPNSFTAKSSLYRHLENIHKLKSGTDHYKACCTTASVDEMCDDGPTILHGDDNIELPVLMYNVDNNLITNGATWKNIRKYLIFHTFKEKPFDYCNMPNWNAQVRGCLMLPQVSDFTDSIKPFKNDFEYVTYQLTSHLTNRDYEIVRTLDKLSKVEIDINYDYSINNLPNIIHDLKDVDSNYISGSTIYRRLQDLPLYNETVVTDDGYSFEYHPLEDAIARLFSSKVNCDNIYLIPQKAKVINTEFFHSKLFHDLYYVNDMLPLLAIGLYVDDFPVSDRLPVGAKNIGFYVHNVHLSFLRELGDAYLFWSLLSKDIPKESWLPHLMKDVEKVKTVRVFHAGLQRYITLRVVVIFAHGDTIELNDLSYMISVLGHNACCFKCCKHYSRLFLINEQGIAKRSLSHRKAKVTELFESLQNSTDSETKKAIEEFQKTTGYTYHFTIPWEQLEFDIYEKGTIDVLHVEFNGTGCAKTIVKLMLSLCNEEQYNLIQKRIKDLVGIDIDRSTNLHAQQWENIIRSSTLTFHNIIPIKYYNILVNRVLFVSLLKCQCLDDNLISNIRKAFHTCRLNELEVLSSDLINTPNFHREEELVNQITDWKIPALFTECAVGEKMNKECKEPFDKKFSIPWAMKQLTLQRYILKQISRNNQLLPKPFSSKKENSEDKWYYTKIHQGRISSIYFATFHLYLDNFVQKFSSSIKVGRIIEFEQEEDKLYLKVVVYNSSPFAAECYEVSESSEVEHWLINSIVPAFVGKMDGKLYYSPFL